MSSWLFDSSAIVAPTRPGSTPSNVAASNVAVAASKDGMLLSVPLIVPFVFPNASLAQSSYNFLEIDGLFVWLSPSPPPPPGSPPPEPPTPPPPPLSVIVQTVESLEPEVSLPSKD